MSPTYHEVAPKIDLDDEAPKPIKKKTKTVSPMTTTPLQIFPSITFFFYIFSSASYLLLVTLASRTYHTIY
jgi:hypothetical protein